MQLSCEDKSAMLSRLDNVRILKLLQINGFGVIKDHDWGPCYGDVPHPENTLFFPALKVMFEENFQPFYLEENTPAGRKSLRKEISDFMECNVKLPGIGDLNYAIGFYVIKHDSINSLAKKKVKNELKNLLTRGSLIDVHDMNIFEINLVKTGFIIHLLEIFSYSGIIENIINALNHMKLVETEEKENLPHPPMPEINIKIQPHIAEIDAVTENGLKISKKFHPVELVRALVQHTVVPEEIKPPEPTINSCCTGLLPHNHTGISTVFVKTKTKTDYTASFEPGKGMSYEPKSAISSMGIGVLIPADKYDFNYNGDIFEIPFPQMLFVYELQEERLSSCRCFALKKGWITAETKLYEFPFGNIGNRGGSICFGSNKLPPFKNLSELETFYRFVLALEHTDDFYIPVNDKSQRQLIEELAQEQEFDESLLLEVGEIKQLLI